MDGLMRVRQSLDRERLLGLLWRHMGRAALICAGRFRPMPGVLVSNSWLCPATARWTKCIAWIATRADAAVASSLLKRELTFHSG
jgi:hypothetical protein